MRQLPELVFKPPQKLLLLEKSFVEGEFVKKCLLIAVASIRKVFLRMSVRDVCNGE
jgi:hypothetical protein